jgi:hypothetical protein
LAGTVQPENGGQNYAKNFGPEPERKDKSNGLKPPALLPEVVDLRQRLKSKKSQK